MTGRWGKRHTQLPDCLKERRGYCKLIEEKLHLTGWRDCFGRGYGPFVRQTAEWMNEWMNERKKEWMNTVYILMTGSFFQPKNIARFTFLTAMLLKIECVLYWVSSSWFFEGSLIPSSSEWISATSDGLKAHSVTIFCHCSTLKNNSQQAFNLHQVTKGHITEDFNLQPTYILPICIYCFAILKCEH